MKREEIHNLCFCGKPQVYSTPALQSKKGVIDNLSLTAVATKLNNTLSKVNATSLYDLTVIGVKPYNGFGFTAGGDNNYSNSRCRFLGGSITAVTPVNNTYTITTPAELAWIAAQVNAGNSFEGKIINVNNPLDLTAHNWVL